MQNVLYGYLFGAGLMITGGLVGRLFGVAAEGRSPEEVAAPLTLVGAAQPGYAAQPSGRFRDRGISG